MYTIIYEHMFDYNEGYAQDSPFFSMFIFVKVVGLANIAPKMSSEESRSLARGLMGRGGSAIDLTALRQRLSDTLFSTDAKWETNALHSVAQSVFQALSLKNKGIHFNVAQAARHVFGA